jgi:hypothetical protein
MLGLLGVVRPRWPHLSLGRSRQAGLDIHGHIFFENLPTQHGPSHTSFGLRGAVSIAGRYLGRRTARRPTSHRPAFKEEILTVIDTHSSR